MKNSFTLINVLLCTVLFAACKKESRIDESLWEVRYVSPASYYLLDMQFMDSEHGAILANMDMGTGNFRQQLIYTKDGGRLWIENSFKLANGHLISHIHMFADRSILGIATDGSVMESQDLGRTWNLKSQSKLPSAKQLVFPYSETRGFVAATSILCKTTDGGITWQWSHDNSLPRVESIQFPSGPEVGYAAEGFTGSMVNKGTLSKTIDGGNSWTRIEKTFADILDASFVSNDLGYLFTNDQNLWVTRDGGSTWGVVNDRMEIPVRTSHFVSEKQGFFAENGSGIWMTKDGGKSWEIISPASESPSQGTGNSRFCRVGQKLYLMMDRSVLCFNL